MKISEIIAEENGENRDKAVIRLYREGVWYRAYEWSAYLAHFFPNGLSDVQRLSPIHRSVKDVDGGVISVGLKLDMMRKFLPDTNPVVRENCVDVTVDLSGYSDAKDGDQAELLRAWKESVPVKDKPENKNGVPQILSRPMTFSAIMKSIITFQLESRTPDDAYRFVRELKDMVAQLI